MSSIPPAPSGAPSPSLLEAALAYAKLGWHIFPCKPRDKKPLIATGFHAATCDLTVVTHWWEQHPTANIGLAPGPSGLVIGDLDSSAAEEVARHLGLLDVETLTVRTGRTDFAGRHLYFKHPGGERIGNLRLGFRDGLLVKIDGGTPGLEIKADAGYVLLPPSIHPSGRAYAFA